MVISTLNACAPLSLPSQQNAWLVHQVSNENITCERSTTLGTALQCLSWADRERPLIEADASGYLQARSVQHFQHLDFQLAAYTKQPLH